MEWEKRVLLFHSKCEGAMVYLCYCLKLCSKQAVIAFMRQIYTDATAIMIVMKFMISGHFYSVE